MPDYRKLRAFALAQQLSEQVHVLAAQIPSRRAPGLRVQLCRAVASVPANITEGAAQERQAGFNRFLRIALGSANETATQLRLAQSLSPTLKPLAYELEQRTDLVAAMLARLIATVQENAARQENQQRAERAQKRSTTISEKRDRISDI